MNLRISILLLLIVTLLASCSDIPQDMDPKVDVNAPVFSTAGGLYEPGITVEISCESPASTIKYTTDNSTPTRNHGTTYTGPVSITKTTNLKAITYCNSCNESDVASEYYIIKKYSFDCTIRDFTPETSPDFEQDVSLMPVLMSEGLVSNTLGADKKPVYANPDALNIITSAYTFNQWYNDVDGVNIKILKEIPLTPDATYLVYENTLFFPIDGEGFGNYFYNSYQYNYHFTVEIHSAFLFNGNEEFRFIGDDDIWIFINNRLVIDIGGLHGPVEKSVTLNSAKASELGLLPGQVYSLDIFTAERHIVNSTFRFFTNAVLVSNGE